MLIIVTVLSFVPIKSFVFECWSHFRAHYFFAAFFGLFCALFLKNKRLIVIALVLTLINGMEILPWYLPQVPKENIAKQANHSLRLMQSNVFWLNSDYQILIDNVKKEQPDVLVLQEFTPQWSENISELVTLYPYRMHELREGSFGMGLFSKYPLTDSLVFDEKNFGIVSFQTKLEFKKNKINIFAIHPPPPTNGLLYSLRDKEFKLLKERLTLAKGSKIVIGDFNSSMWSPSYKKLIASSGMRNVRKGFGLLPSWPTNLPIGRIPIDHCLVSEELLVKNIQLGLDIGSDHYPIIVDLELR